MVRTADQAASTALCDWLRRHWPRHPESEILWRDNAELAALWAIAQRLGREPEETLELPPQVPPEQVRYFLEQDSKLERLSAVY